MLLTVEERTAFDRAKHAKAIRVTLYELGIFIGALWLADKAMAMWPQYALGILGAMVGAWVGLIILRYRDFRSLEFIEERLGEDEAKRDVEAAFRERYSDD